MNICITAAGDSLNASVDERFGRCAYFVFYNTATHKAEFLKNPHAEGMSGVGVRVGQLVAEKNSDVVLTGKVGPNAQDTLKAANVPFIVDVKGSVQEAIDHYLNSKGLPS